MKRYTTVYANGALDATSNMHEAKNFTYYDEDQIFFLAGKKVSPVEFYAAVEVDVQAAWDKKLETHKRVKVLHGSSSLCYVTKWVRR